MPASAPQTITNQRRCKEMETPYQDSQQPQQPQQPQETTQELLQLPDI